MTGGLCRQCHSLEAGRALNGQRRCDRGGRRRRRRGCRNAGQRQIARGGGVPGQARLGIGGAWIMMVVRSASLKCAAGQARWNDGHGWRAQGRDFRVVAHAVRVAVSRGGHGDFRGERRRRARLVVAPCVRCGRPKPFPRCPGLAVGRGGRMHRCVDRRSWRGHGGFRPRQSRGAAGLQERRLSIRDARGTAQWRHFRRHRKPDGRH